MISIRESNLSEIIFLGKEIKGCELAVTDKAKCIMCKKLIPQGTPRLYVYGELKQAPPDEGIVKIKRFICYKCSETIIDSKEQDYSKTIQDGEAARQKLIKQTKIKEEFNELLKDEKIIKKIQNDEIIKELEHEDDNNWDETW